MSKEAEKLIKEFKEHLDAMSKHMARAITEVEDIIRKEIESDLETLDPYLVKGVACECWDDDKSKTLLYFCKYDKKGEPAFTEYSDLIEDENDDGAYTYTNYRVIGTIWDFAPDWANWYAVHSDGTSFYFSNEPVLSTEGFWCRSGGSSAGASRDFTVTTIGEHGSKRQRPEWAKQ